MSTVWQAIGAFAVTNIDDLVVLAVFFGQAPGNRGAAWRVVAGCASWVECLARPPQPARRR
ncbi:hypothetical protein [Nocardia sp. NPDC020380]|uniref:hypothetical protein n=1 Tax=Nocardia sp. NPDC020380 TaxID=3364309 RepID=UPI0037AFCDEE